VSLICPENPARVELAVRLRDVGEDLRLDRRGRQRGRLQLHRQKTRVAGQREVEAVELESLGEDRDQVPAVGKIQVGQVAQIVLRALGHDRRRAREAGDRGPMTGVGVARVGGRAPVGRRPLHVAARVVLVDDERVGVDRVAGVDGAGGGPVQVELLLGPGALDVQRDRVRGRSLGSLHGHGSEDPAGQGEAEREAERTTRRGVCCARPHRDHLVLASRHIGVDGCPDVAAFLMCCPSRTSGRGSVRTRKRRPSGSTPLDRPGLTPWSGPRSLPRMICWIGSRRRGLPHLWRRYALSPFDVTRVNRSFGRQPISFPGLRRRAWMYRCRPCGDDPCHGVIARAIDAATRCWPV